MIDMFKLKKCIICKAYTLKNMHCKEKSIIAHPPKFNPNDKYARERRKMKNLE